MPAAAASACMTTSGIECRMAAFGKGLSNNFDDMADGKNFVREQIVGYQPQRKIEIDVYDGSLPLKSARASFDFREKGAGRTEVSMTMDFVPKFGIIGALMIPMMKPQFRKMLKSMLDGNAAYVERGQAVPQAA